MNINCPYCDAEQDIDYEDGYGYEEDVKHEMQCSECEKNFVFITSLSFNYEAEKADCLNDSKHEYELSHTYPKAFSKMICKHCDDKRELTEEERLNFKIESIENYFKNLKL